MSDRHHISARRATSLSYGGAIRLLALVLTLTAQTVVGAVAQTPPTVRADRPTTFTNPVMARGADPWVIQWEGQYIMSQSRGGVGVFIGATPHLYDWNNVEWTHVWQPEPDRMWSRHIWAPEIHRINDKWYIYVAADDGDNVNHRMYVLEGQGPNPWDPYELKGKITDPSDRWAIDATVLQMPDGKLYFVWSGWEGYEDVAQFIYIAPMSDPLTVSGERVLISKPDYEWEKRGGAPAVNEGPQVLWNGDHLFMTYSASGSWSDDYCLGLLRWTGGDPLDPASWEKHPEPVFQKTNRVFGPGHASFAKSPDGTEDWIVYHAARRSGAGWNRNIRIQPFTWNEDGSPNFGEPIPAGVPLPIPSDLVVTPTPVPDVVNVGGPGEMRFADASRGRPFSKDPSVIWFQDQYYLYYSMRHERDDRQWGIGIARSDDLIHWEKISELEVGGDYEARGFCAPAAIVLDGKVHLFYQNYGYGRDDAICHAWSQDGVHFTRNPTNPVFRPTGDWNCGRAIDAEPFVHDGKLFLYWATRDPDFRVQMLGVATAPLDSDYGRNAWTQQCDAPILAPVLEWEKNCIEAASICRRGDRLFMFYAGAYNNEPQQVGVAVSEDGLIWERLSNAPFLSNGEPGTWNSSESGHPSIFVDPDGATYLFFQGNNDNGRTWFLSKVRVYWDDQGLPTLDKPL